MKTETCETKTTPNDETPELNRFTRAIVTRSASGLRRFSAACLNRLSQLKEQLRRELVAEYGGSLNPMFILQAVQEADSLAATTAFPGLFLPALAEEKVRTASAWNSRQAAIRRPTRALAA